MDIGRQNHPPSAELAVLAGRLSGVGGVARLTSPAPVHDPQPGHWHSADLNLTPTRCGGRSQRHLSHRKAFRNSHPSPPTVANTGQRTTACRALWAFRASPRLVLLTSLKSTIGILFDVRANRVSERCYVCPRWARKYEERESPNAGPHP